MIYNNKTNLANYYYDKFDILNCEKAKNLKNKISQSHKRPRFTWLETTGCVHIQRQLGRS